MQSEAVMCDSFLRSLIIEVKFRYSYFMRKLRKPKDLCPFMGNISYKEKDISDDIVIPTNWQDKEDVARFNREVSAMTKEVTDYLDDVASGKRGWIFGPLDKKK